MEKLSIIHFLTNNDSKEPIEKRASAVIEEFENRVHTELVMVEMIHHIKAFLDQQQQQRQAAKQ